MTATRSPGTVTSAVYVNFAAQLSYAINENAKRRKVGKMGREGPGKDTLSARGSLGAE